MTGLILAAGASSRLGEAKQVLVYQGQSLLERSIRLAFSVCKEVLVCLGAEVEQTTKIIDKLQKEFGFLGKTANEIDSFNEQFKRLKQLWTTKLCTPLEEVQSVQESL